MRIRKGDTVLIISGKDKGRKGKVLKALPERDKIMVEGINLRKKHVRPKKSGEKGQIVEVSVPIDISNLKFSCLKCSKTTKIGYKSGEKEKYRICKKCGQRI